MLTSSTPANTVGICSVSPISAWSGLLQLKHVSNSFTEKYNSFNITVKTLLPASENMDAVNQNVNHTWTPTPTTTHVERIQIDIKFHPSHPCPVFALVSGLRQKCLLKQSISFITVNVSLCSALSHAPPYLLRGWIVQQDFFSCFWLTHSIWL